MDAVQIQSELDNLAVQLTDQEHLFELSLNDSDGFEKAKSVFQEIRRLKNRMDELKEKLHGY